MKHLKLFQTEAEYTAYKNSGDFILPNVSYTVDSPKTFYNPLIVESYKMVDLGLPSGLKWADRNIGAASPEDAGLYFQWGDTVGYTAEQVTNGEKRFASDWSDYFDYFDTIDYVVTFNKYTTDKLTVLQPEDDAATVNMGSEYRMPTEADFNELINNCTVTFIDRNGNEFSQSDAQNGTTLEDNLKGIKFTGSNNNSIFIPAYSLCGDGSPASAYDNVGLLWASSLYSDDSTYSCYFFFDNYGNHYVLSNYRYYGMSIRGVCN